MTIRTFAYCRVSTSEQTTDNQVQTITERGHNIPAMRVVTETISGTVKAMQRPEFANLINNKLEAGDTLVVLKLDRLGRDNVDILSTVEMLQAKDIKVVSLDLPVSDLTSPEGKLMLGIMSAYAAFERDRLVERTNEGLDRARAEGKVLGRPKADVEEIQKLKAGGLSQSKVATALSIGIATVKRHWNV